MHEHQRGLITTTRFTRTRHSDIVHREFIAAHGNRERVRSPSRSINSRLDPPINPLFRLPPGTSRALVPKVRQSVRLGSVCGASQC